MFVQALVTECDFNGIRYDAPVEGAWAVAQGATGRWCAVMFVGPEWLKKSGQKVLSYDEAVETAERLGGEIDF